MEKQFTPISPAPTRALKKLETVCSTARSLEEIIPGWVGREKTIVVTRAAGTKQAELAISFMQGNDAVAVAHLPAAQLLESYPEFEELNETMIPFDDQEGGLPDTEWFDRRNARLRVTCHEELDMNVAPAGAIGELVLSYALSSVGFAEIGLGTRCQGEQFLKVGLMFFGDDPSAEEGGWYEYVASPLSQLRNHIPKAYWV